MIAFENGGRMIHSQHVAKYIESLCHVGTFIQTNK